MHTRSGRTWSIYTDHPVHISDTIPAALVTHISLDTSGLLQIALDREDQRQLDHPDDTEGAALDYDETAAGPSSARAEPPQGNDNILLAAEGMPQVANTSRDAQGEEPPYERGQVEKKRKRKQSNGRKKAKRIKLAQMEPLDRPGLHGRSLHAFPSVPTTPVDFNVADLPAAAEGGHIGKRITPEKSCLWTLKELHEANFIYKTWDGWYVGQAKFKAYY